MYYIFGFDEVIKTISSTVGCRSQDYFTCDDKARNSYLNFLNKASVFECPVTWQGIRVVDLNEIRILSPNYYESRKEFFDG